MQNTQSSYDADMKPSVIIIGAGAGADFRIRNLINEAEYGDALSIAMPVGESLVREMMNFGNELPKLFLYEYLRRVVLSDKERFKYIHANLETILQVLYLDLYANIRNDNNYYTKTLIIRLSEQYGNSVPKPNFDKRCKSIGANIGDQVTLVGFVESCFL